MHEENHMDKCSEASWQSYNNDVLLKPVDSYFFYGGVGRHLYFRPDIILGKWHSKHTLNTYFSGIKIDPKYAFLNAFFLICPSCHSQNLSIWPKAHPFFPILHVLAPLNDVRAYIAWSWKTTLITWFFFTRMISNFKYKWPRDFLSGAKCENKNLPRLDVGTSYLIIMMTACTALLLIINFQTWIISTLEWHCRFRGSDLLCNLW